MDELSYEPTDEHTAHAGDGDDTEWLGEYGDPAFDDNYLEDGGSYDAEPVEAFDPASVAELEAAIGDAVDSRIMERFGPILADQAARTEAQQIDAGTAEVHRQIDEACRGDNTLDRQQVFDLASDRVSDLIPAFGETPETATLAIQWAAEQLRQPKDELDVVRKHFDAADPVQAATRIRAGHERARQPRTEMDVLRQLDQRPGRDASGRFISRNV